MSRRDDDGSEYDVPDWMVQVGRLFGLSEIQARWKAIRLLRSLKRAREELAPPSSRIETRGCPSCHAAQPSTAKVCASCGGKMTTSFAAAFRMLGLSLPPMITVSSLLMLANVGIYAFMWTRFPREAFGGWTVRHLLAAGANAGSLSLHGEPWRLVTYMFLHIGVIHIAFNTMALAQIGPTVEEVFGRGRMVLFYVLTGVVGGLASASLNVGVSAGASGALMGLVGVAAGWGHRLGTGVGRDVRNRMLQWGVYTMIFGFVVHADNVAHAGGFVSGALLGYAVRTEHVDRTKVELANVITGLLGGVVSVLAVMFVLARVAHEPRTTKLEEDESGYDDDSAAEDADDDAAVAAPARPDAPARAAERLEACRRMAQNEPDAAADVLRAFGADADAGAGVPQMARFLCEDLGKMRAFCAGMRRLGARAPRNTDLEEVCREIP